MEVNAETVNIAATEETSQGAATPPTTGWLNLEADAIGDPGPSYKSQARMPFTITRQLRRPFLAGMDCVLTLDVDVIKDHLDFFGPAIFKSDWKHSGGTGQSKFLIAAVVDGGVGADSFTVEDDGALPEGTLIVTRGLADEENNGLFRVAAGSTDTSVKVPTDTLVPDASPNANATLDVAGFQFAESDAELDADGNLITTTKDLRTLGLQEHQIVYFASSEEVDPPYCFDNAEYYGFTEILTIEQHKITFRRRQWTVGAADDGDGKTIRLFFTKWVRNVARRHADENLVSHAFEVTYPGLAAGPADAYEKLLGYMLDQATFNFPTEGKVSLQLTFVGKTATPPETDRWTGPSAALNVVTGLAVSTSADIKRVHIDNVDESGLMTDFQDLKITLRNNIQAEKAVGHLGNRFTPLGAFEAQIEAEAYFTDPDVVTAVRDKRIIRAFAGGRNDDFGFMLDVPSTGAMESPKKIEHNRTVTVSSKISGFMDSDSQFTAGLSMFAYLPTRAPGLET
jgi:hypothetical protein